MANCLCDKCAALCCRYFALPIDNPETRRQYDDIRWYLVHENVVVFIEKKQWFVGILNRCKHLQQDNRCGIYETRPAICRNYSTENCDYHGGEYDFERLFTSAEQLWEYANEQLRRKRLIKHKKRIRRGKRRAPLAVISHLSRSSDNGRAVSSPVQITINPSLRRPRNGTAVSLPVVGGVRG